MKRFQVENCVQNARQYAGEEPYENISYDLVGDYIEAETEEEAISLAMDYLKDSIMDNITEGYAEIEDNELLTYDDDDNVVECYYNFTAKNRKFFFEDFRFFLRIVSSCT